MYKIRSCFDICVVEFLNHSGIIWMQIHKFCRVSCLCSRHAQLMWKSEQSSKNFVCLLRICVRELYVGYILVIVSMQSLLHLVSHFIIVLDVYTVQLKKS